MNPQNRRLSHLSPDARKLYETKYKKYLTPSRFEIIRNTYPERIKKEIIEMEQEK